MELQEVEGWAWCESDEKNKQCHYSVIPSLFCDSFIILRFLHHSVIPSLFCDSFMDTGKTQVVGCAAQPKLSALNRTHNLM